MNLTAIATLRAIEDAGRAPSDEEWRQLRRFTGWGPLPQIFDDESHSFTGKRRRLRELLTDREWRAGRASTPNAHYTPQPLAEAIWTGVRQLGFTGGRVLEPGCGAGTFIATAPTDLDCELVGVELEPITARIAATLWPEATIINANLKHLSDSDHEPFDLVIGNVPFGNYGIHDRTLSPRLDLSIHNYAITKGLSLLRPGGLLAVITSRYTLDHLEPHQREVIADHGDFLGALRLPDDAMAASAGTQVVADIVVLRRHGDQIAPSDERDWLGTVTTTVDGRDVDLNAWFAANPDAVLGDATTTGTMYRDGAYTVKSTGEPLPDLVTHRFAPLAEYATHRGLLLSPGPMPSRRVEPDGPPPTVSTPPTEPPQRSSSDPPSPPAGNWPPRRAREGSIHRHPDGTFHRFHDGTWSSFTPKPKTQTKILTAATGLRDHLTELLEAEATSPDDDPTATEHLDSLRSGLHDRYQALIRLLPRPGIGLPKSLRKDGTAVLHPLGGFRDDPDYPALLALEHVDLDTKVVTPAAIFTQRTIRPRRPIQRVDTPDEALAVCLDEHGRVDLDEIARLLELPSPAAARTELGTLVFTDPTDDELIPARRYLAGNVRARLALAERAATTDPSFQVSVDALRAVLPAWVPETDITVRPGVSWLTPTEIGDFITATVGDIRGLEVTYSPQIGWVINAPSHVRWGATMTEEFGTSRMDAIEVLRRGARSEALIVYDALPDGGRVVNVTESTAAAERFDRWTRALNDWCFATDPDRTDALTHRYNELFNAWVEPDYSDVTLTCPGLTDSFTLRPHQHAAIARQIAEGNTLLAHVVGAGKTAEMIVAAMEQRRLGLITKPAFVVPNHLVEQFAREVRQLYPTAAVLIPPAAASTRQSRTQLAARCAAGNWDAVIIGESMFTRLPLGPELETRYLQAAVDELTELATHHQGQRKTIKEIEKQRQRFETRLENLRDHAGTDDGVRFEELGIDYLFVDEAHGYKNLTITSANSTLNLVGAKKATDLEWKLTWLRETRTPSRIATFATGTPVSNRVSELYAMQRYLQPDTLDALGLASFDAWAAQFGQMITRAETDQLGTGLRVNTRFAAYNNVPELMALVRQVADIRTATDLDLPTPAISGGKPEMVIVPSSDALETYTEQLVDRSRRLGADRREDNWLAITGDARRAALDLRLVGHRPDPIHTKLTVLADRITQIHHTHADRRYPDPHHPDRTHPTPGACQVVFMDQGTPGTNHARKHPVDLYTDLRERLVERGVPADKIRFVHEARTRAAQADLFTACRDGRIAVIIGSTEKMGTGANLQHRLVALHHADPPWRPADIEQREGRILRQGNTNPEVHILRYSTARSYDAVMWSGLERKAGFIGQLMNAGTTARTIEEIDTPQAGYAEIASLTLDDPDLFRQAELARELQRYDALESEHLQSQRRLARRIQDLTRRRGATLSRLTALEDLTPTPTTGQLFHYTPTTGDAHTDRSTADHHLSNQLPELPVEQTTETDLGILGGLDVWATRPRPTDFTVGVGPAPLHLSFQITRADLDAGTRLVTRLERLLRAIPTRIADAEARVDELDTDLADAHRLHGQPYPHADQRAHTQLAYAELTAAIEARAQAARERADDSRDEPDHVTPIDRDDRSPRRHATAIAGPRHRPAPVQPADPDPTWLDPHQAAQLLDITTTQLVDRLKSGQLDGYNIAGQLRLRRADLESLRAESIPTRSVRSQRR